MKIPRLLILSLLISLTNVALTFAQYTPDGFYSLARRGDLEGLTLILAENPESVVKDAALEAAVLGQQKEAIQLLVDHGANVNYVNPDGTALLVNAIMLGYDDTAVLLLSLGASPQVIGYRRIYQGYPMDWHWSPLMAAAYQGKMDLIQRLIDAGADVKQEGYSVSTQEPETAADIAAYSGHLDILKLLLEKGGHTAEETIFKAARAGHLEVVKFFVGKGAEVNKPSREGKTLLMEAAWWGHLELLEYLLESGADVHAVDQNGYTALSDAAANGGSEFPQQLEIVKALVRAGANVNQSDPFKETPLMRAQDPKVIQFLIEAGAH